jgi:2,3-bisphosphoglycerate-dependent phosphoglycerate mutase
MTAPYRLVLLRHGESEWNAKNLFTGWVDVPLNDKGRAEAARAAELLLSRACSPTCCTPRCCVGRSPPRSCASTASTATGFRCGAAWRLNERHYGALQGKDKKQTLAEYGEEQFMTWRRSYDTPPPPIDDADEFSQSGDARYADLPPELLPRTECLADVIERMLPYWYDTVVPDLPGRSDGPHHGARQLAAGVGQASGRLSEKAVVGLNIPTGIPLYYELDDTLAPITSGGVYLDPDAAAAAIEAVKNQGR